MLFRSGSSADRTLLAGRLATEPFWAVQSKIAEALGDAADDDEEHTARDALLAGLKIDHPKARAAVVEALGQFAGDDDVAIALRKIVEQGDASYRVRSNAIEAYADVSDDLSDLASLWDSLLATDSYREMVRAAALRAIGDHCNDDLFEKLIAWSAPGKPPECRAAAIGAIGTALSEENLAENNLSDESVDRGLKMLGDWLASRSRRIRGAALYALADMGSAARPLLPKIDRLAIGGNMRLGRTARRTAKKIREKESPLEQLEDLRNDMAELRKENERLADEMKRLQATSRADEEQSVSAGSSGE